MLETRGWPYGLVGVRTAMYVCVFGRTTMLGSSRGFCSFKTLWQGLAYGLEAWLKLGKGFQNVDKTWHVLRERVKVCVESWRGEESAR